MKMDRGHDGRWHKDPRPNKDIGIKYFGWFFSNPFAFLAFGLIGQFIVLVLILWRVW